MAVNNNEAARDGAATVELSHGSTTLFGKRSAPPAGDGPAPVLLVFELARAREVSPSRELSAILNEVYGNKPTKRKKSQHDKRDRCPDKLEQFEEATRPTRCTANRIATYKNLGYEPRR